MLYCVCDKIVLSSASVHLFCFVFVCLSTSKLEQFSHSHLIHNYHAPPKKCIVLWCLSGVKTLSFDQLVYVLMLRMLGQLMYIYPCLCVCMSTCMGVHVV